MKTMDEASSARPQPTSPNHDEMTSWERKEQFGGWTKRRWREIRRKIFKYALQEEKETFESRVRNLRWSEKAFWLGKSEDKSCDESEG